MAHTPGPWRRTTYNGLSWVGSDTQFGGLVCSLVGVSPADADLIMAAPALAAENARLREAIERLLPAAENWACHQEVYYYPEGKSSASAAIRMARAALTGEA